MKNLLKIGVVLIIFTAPGVATAAKKNPFSALSDIAKTYAFALNNAVGTLCGQDLQKYFSPNTSSEERAQILQDKIMHGDITHNTVAVKRRPLCHNDPFAIAEKKIRKLAPELVNQGSLEADDEDNYIAYGRNCLTKTLELYADISNINKIHDDYVNQRAVNILVNFRYSNWTEKKCIETLEQTIDTIPGKNQDFWTNAKIETKIAELLNSLHPIKQRAQAHPGILRATTTKQDFNHFLQEQSTSISDSSLMPSQQDVFDSPKNVANIEQGQEPQGINANADPSLIQWPQEVFEPSSDDANTQQRQEP